MNRTFSRILFAFLVSAAAGTAVSAQGTEKDYERANGLDRQLSGKVWHSDIRPAWVGKSNLLILKTGALREGFHSGRSGKED
jgi:hypothetical protein